MKFGIVKIFDYAVSIPFFALQQKENTGSMNFISMKKLSCVLNMMMTSGTLPKSIVAVRSINFIHSRYINAVSV